MAGDLPAGERHLTAEEMAQMLSRYQDPGKTEHQVVRHLLGCCKPCETTAEEVRRITAEFAHWNHSYALAESVQAPELWRALEALPFPEQLAAVTGEAMYQTWGLCRLLQRLSGEAAARHEWREAAARGDRRDAEKAAELANLAVAISCRLESTYDVDWIEDLQARSYARLGDARRLLGELHGAADACELAREARAAGTDYPSVEAEVAALEGLLRRDQRRLVTAAALFERVHQLHTDPDWAVADADAADRHLGGRALLHRAWCLYHLGRHETAGTELERAAELIDERREPRLGLALRHGRVWTAMARQRFAEAEALMGPASVLAAEIGDDPVRLRLRRAAGRLAAAAGEVGAAKETLRETAAAMAGIDQGFDCALALLDLADLCQRTGDMEAVRQVGLDVLCAHSAREVQREEMAFLLLFQHATEQDRFTLELGERLAVQLEIGRKPSLGWWSGSGTMLSLERMKDAKECA